MFLLAMYKPYNVLKNSFGAKKTFHFPSVKFCLKTSENSPEKIDELLLINKEKIITKRKKGIAKFINIFQNFGCFTLSKKAILF